MSLKSIIKEYCPLSLLRQLMYMRLAGRMCLSFLSEPQRRRRARRIIAEAEKYLPYYQDDLSREILRMREEYLMTNDEAIFFKIPEQDEWKEYQLVTDIFPTREYSGIVLLYDEKKTAANSKGRKYCCQNAAGKENSGY